MEWKIKDVMFNNYAYKPFFTSCLLGMILFSCNKAPTDTQADDIERITAISAERAKAFNQGDAEGIARYFAEDAYLMAPGKAPLQGPKAVESYYQSIFDQYHTQLESGYDEVDVSGPLAYGRGTAHVVLIPKNGGDTLTSTSKYINILKKQSDGTWITTHDIWNGNDE